MLALLDKRQETGAVSGGDTRDTTETQRLEIGQRLEGDKISSLETRHLQSRTLQNMAQLQDLVVE